jgi:hypothetical protein
MYTKTQRIRCHDENKDFVSNKLAKMKGVKILIIEEATIQTSRENFLKPDLVVNQGRVHVVNTPVHHEDTGYLEERYRSKVQKYTPLLDTGRATESPTRQARS